MNDIEINEVENKIKYNFKNKNLIIESLKHKSIDKINNNSKYELLGDRIINLYVAQSIFDKTKDADSMHNNMKNIISNKLLSKGFDDKFQNYLKCSEIVRNNFTDESKIEANIFESILGAIYLDNKDFNFIFNYIHKKTNIDNIIDNNFEDIFKKDFKTCLQEYTSKNNMGYPKYETKQLNKNETISICIINNKEYKQGKGKNKKDAEQEAAKVTFLELNIK